MQRMIVGFRDIGVMLAVVGAIFAAAITPLAAQSTDAEGQGLEQVELTEAQVKGYIKVGPKLSELFDRIDKAGGEPDDKLQAELEDVAKEGGFQSFDDLETVVSNITFVMSGINEEDGTFQEPVEVLREELEATKADDSVKGEEKEQLIASIEESIKLTPKLKYPGNVKVVQKNYKELAALFQE